MLRDISGPIAVTGATGWFGSVATTLLYRALGEDAPERVLPFASRPRQLTLTDGRIIDVRPLSDLGDGPSPEVVLHFAFLTRARLADVGHAAFVRQNATITETVLDAIALHRPRLTVATSSGAVYGPDGAPQTDLQAEPYGTLKHRDEVAFREAVGAVGGSLAVPRVFSVAAEVTPDPGTYALGSMIQMAQSGGPIDVRARGLVRRSFCGVDEVIAVSLWAAHRGGTTVFDTGGEPTELGRLAELVAREHGLPESTVRRCVDPSAPVDDYTGDGTVMAALAEDARLRLRSLEELVRLASRGMRTQ